MGMGMKSFRVSKGNTKYRAFFRVALPYWFARKGEWYDIMSDEMREGAHVRGIVFEMGWRKKREPWGADRLGPYFAANKWQNGVNDRRFETEAGIFNL